MRLFKSFFAKTGIAPSQFTASSSAFTDLDVSKAPDLDQVLSGLKQSATADVAPHGPARELKDWEHRHGASRRRPSPLGLAAKRGFDVTAALAMLVVLAPLLAVVAWLVMRDGGPCVFGHTRVGIGGTRFQCLKFRSMVIDADTALKRLLESDPAARAEWERDFKLKRDVRVTRIGQFMRKTSIDELPQLWNVVRGDMSLVGPRPVIEKELERYGASVVYYLEGRPGITGLWQVSGRNDTDYPTRVALDVAYVREWSFGQDLVILLRTVRVVLRGSGAY